MLPLMACKTRTRVIHKNVSQDFKCYYSEQVLNGSDLKKKIIFKKKFIFKHNNDLMLPLTVGDF